VCFSSHTAFSHAKVIIQQQNKRRNTVIFSQGTSWKGQNKCNDGGGGWHPPLAEYFKGRWFRRKFEFNRDVLERIFFDLNIAL